MISTKWIITGIVALAALIILAAAFYTVDQREQVVITQFGEPVRVVKDPGLHIKTPFIQAATFFEKRILEWDGSATQIPTKDKKFILVDTYARWKISDPLKFYQSVGNELSAQTRLDNVIDAAVRDFITEQNLIEVVRNSNRPLVQSEGEEIEREDIEIEMGREKITREIFAKASEMTPQYGIELIDVRVKHINYVQSVREKVFSRMIAERERIAEQYRSEGQGERSKILGDMEKELQKITSEAYRTAEEIRGQADGKSTQIYASAYNKDPEFYSFLKALETYPETIDKDSWLILTTDSDYFKYLKEIR
ncbi:MAG: protease modulator HflC [Candidatus Zixiibacteriota bacterium]|nr:MAG: protease modulator HflC [candidate division Zixibacteria bacterium]